MAARVIAFPGAVVDPPRPGLRAGRVRARYICELEDQARAGDNGACAEFHLALIRDFLAEDRRHLLPRCHMAIAAVRKLRRQLAGLGKEER
jgi:hypothetical protein